MEKIDSFIQGKQDFSGTVSIMAMVTSPCEELWGLTQYLLYLQMGILGSRVHSQKQAQRNKLFDPSVSVICLCDPTSSSVSSLLCVLMQKTPLSPDLGTGLTLET